LFLKKEKPEKKGEPKAPGQGERPCLGEGAANAITCTPCNEKKDKTTSSAGSSASSRIRKELPKRSKPSRGGWPKKNGPQKPGVRRKERGLKGTKVAGGVN